MYNYDTGDGEELLALATAAVRNIYWVGQKFTSELANFPAGWTGTASGEASRFVARLESVATQLNLVVGDLKDLLPKYGLVIKAARIDLDRAVGGLVDKFEEKFATRAEGGFSFDVTGLVLSVIAAWSKTFDAATGELFGETEEENIGTIAGFWWTDLAKSYFDTVNHLNTEMAQLAQNFMDAVPGFTDHLPRLDEAPARQGG